MKASYFKRCGCRDPETGKWLDLKCSRLTSRRHGTYGFATRLDTSKKLNRQLKRIGYPTLKAAENAFKQAESLVALAHDDEVVRRKIGDLIFACKSGEPLPDVEETRRKLRVGIDLGPTAGTVRELLEDWYASRRGKKASSLLRWRQHLDHYLIPQFGDIPRDRLRAAHIDALFDLIEDRTLRSWQPRRRAGLLTYRGIHAPSIRLPGSRHSAGSSPHCAMPTAGPFGDAWSTSTRATVSNCRQKNVLQRVFGHQSRSRPSWKLQNTTRLDCCTGSCSCAGYAAARRAACDGATSTWILVTPRSGKPSCSSTGGP